MPWMKGHTKPIRNAAKVGRMKIGANLRMGRWTRLISFLGLAKVISLSFSYNFKTSDFLCAGRKYQTPDKTEELVTSACAENIQ